MIPLELKKGNSVSIYKKGEKQNIEHYRLISLHPIWGKIFEKVIHKQMFTNFINLSDLPEYKLDTCVKQLLSITHEIYRYLGHGIEVKSLFVDISKHLTKFGMKVSYSNY